jgi:hypothetical protein
MPAALLARRWLNTRRSASSSTSSSLAGMSAPMKDSIVSAVMDWGGGCVGWGWGG